MKYRPHAGGLKESLAQQVELERTREALVTHLNKIYAVSLNGSLLRPADLIIKQYGYDNRLNNWQAHEVDDARAIVLNKLLKEGHRNADSFPQRMIVNTFIVTGPFGEERGVLGFIDCPL